MAVAARNYINKIASKWVTKLKQSSFQENEAKGTRLKKPLQELLIKW